MDENNVISLDSFRERRKLNPDLKEAIGEVRRRLREISDKIALNIGKEGDEVVERERLDILLDMYIRVQESIMKIPEKIQSPEDLGDIIQLFNNVVESLFRELKKEGESFLDKNEGG